MKTSKAKLTLDELELESFVTSLDSDLATRITGGVGDETHPTHTEKSDPLHPAECTCSSSALSPAFSL